MKVLVVLSALVAFAAAAALSPSELEFLHGYDYATLFANDEQRKILFDCILEKGKCGAYKHMAELSLQATVNRCAECTPAQKTKYDNILQMLHDKYEPFYNELMNQVAEKKDTIITLF